MNLPDWLEGPVRRALHDLQGAAPIPLRVRYDGTYLWVEETAGSDAAAVYVAEARDAQLTVLIADTLVEQFFPESDRAWGEARPLCPSHTHPALAELLDGEAWWVCPRGGGRVARIGEPA